MSPRRVVVTGTSVLTSLGHDVDDVWQQVCSGRSGIRRIKRFDCSDFAVRFGGEIQDFDACAHMSIDRRDVRRLDRFAQFALVGAQKAITQAGIELLGNDPRRCGVLIGSGIGGLDEIEAQHAKLFDQGPGRVSAFMIPKLMINAASGNISVRWGLRGPSSAVATACASATNAIGDAFRMVRSGMADVMVAGGSEAALGPMGIAGFSRMGALSTRNQEPHLASRPFDRARDGFVLSEGAGILILEELEHAKSRGAVILAEVLGCGFAADATHMTAPDESGQGAAEAIRQSLRDARLNPDQVDCINAHATSTPRGDAAESAAIRQVFGDHRIPVSSTKGQLGHLLGASGAVESVFSIRAINTNAVPPTGNLMEPDPEFGLDFVLREAREYRVNIVLKNSFGFGGHNACLVFGRYS